MAASRLLLRRLVVPANPHTTGPFTSRPSGFLPLLTQFFQSSPNLKFSPETCTPRGYATAARPKKPASKPASESTRKPAAPKKPAPKKKKPAAKKKKPTKKPAKKPAPKRQVKKKTDAQILNAKIRSLRQIALLDEPKRRPSTVWTLYNAQNVSKGNPVGDQMIENGRRYKNMSASERESLNQTALNNRALNIRQRTDWIHSHTPETIRLANNARVRLNRLSENRHKGSNARLTRRHLPLKDDRQVKRPPGAFAQYQADRWASGELVGRSAGDATRALAAEWKALREGEKQKYLDDFEVRREQYLTARAELYPELAERATKLQAKVKARQTRRASSETVGR